MRLRPISQNLLSLTVFFLLFTALCSSTFANVLACDSTTEPITTVEVEINGTVYTGIYQPQNGETYLYDLSPLAPGSYTFRARWKTASSEWSTWSEPYISYLRGSTWRQYPYSGGSEHQSTGQR